MTSPRVVGRYEIRQEIGRGGMAVVHLARQLDMGRDVALKELAAPLTGDPAFGERFLRESRVSGSLSHPNLVTVFDYFEHAGVPYIAMEYLERGSLRPLVPVLTPPQIAGVLEGVLAGLAHAHSRGVVHRDLKPENVLVTGDGRAKVADFGVAKAYNTVWTAHHPTATGMTVGTPAYMAPEQAMGRDIGPWTDLYALGVMAYELVCERLPFPPQADDTPLAVLFRHLTEPVPPVLELRPDADPRLAAWIERLLAKEPEARPADATAAGEELEDIAIAGLGPVWRRHAALPAIRRPPPPHPLATPEAPTPFSAPGAGRDAATPATRGSGAAPWMAEAPGAAGAATPSGAGPAARRRAGSDGAGRPRRRRAAVLLGVGLVVVAGGAVAATGVLGGGGDGGGTGGAVLSSATPACLRALAAGVPAGSVVAGTGNQPFASARQTRDRPATVIFLDGATPVLGIRVVDRPSTTPPVFELTRVLDARCRPVSVVNFGEGTSRAAPDWAPLHLTVAGRPYSAEFDHDTKRGRIEAGLQPLALARLRITAARRTGTGVTVTGSLAADARERVSVVYATPSGARFSGAAKPVGGQFTVRVRVPSAARGGTGGRVTASYPGDDTHGSASASAAA